MQPSPLYEAHNLNPAYQLRYSWAGWPSDGAFPEPPCAEFLTDLNSTWETDGMRLLEHHWSQQKAQLTFSTKPHVSPVFLATRAKGRLQHGLRNAGLPAVKFTRKLSVRSLGKNRTEDVQEYIRGQVDSACFVDPAFRDLLREFTVTKESVNLPSPTATARGRYWYNLHVVLVVSERFRIVERERLALVRDCSFRIARNKAYGISALSVMPDHLHIALRGEPAHSPQEIVLSFQNSLAYALGQNAIWDHNYYVGTFGEYDMGAVRDATPPP